MSQTPRITPWLLALRTLSRSRWRTGLIVLGVVVSAAGLTTAAILISGVRHNVRQTVGRLGADIMVVPAGEQVQREFNELLVSGRPACFYLDQQTVKDVAAVPGVEASSAQTYVETLTNASCCSGKFFLIGFDPKTDFTIRPWLADNDWAALSQRDNPMIAGDRILLRKGSASRFFGTEFTVAGVLSPTGTGMDWSVYVPDDALRKMIAESGNKAELRLRIAQGSASALFIRARAGTDPMDLAERIEQAVPGVQAVLSSTVAAGARRHLDAVLLALVVASAALWALALVLTGVLFSQSVRERRAELGLLLARGASVRLVLSLVVRQAAVIAFSAALAGAAAAAGLLTLVQKPLARSWGTGVLPPASTIAFFVLALGAAVALSAVAASAVPAALLLRADPYETIRKGRAG